MSETGHDVDAAWLLEQARDLLRGRDDVTTGRWPRAAALLARQALETAIDERCAAEHEALGSCTSHRAQLLCLGRLGDPTLAREAAHVWSALSRACHYHAYELPPTAGELETWFTIVDRLITAGTPRSRLAQRA